MNSVRRGTSGFPLGYDIDPTGAFLAAPQREALANLRACLAGDDPFLLLTGAAGTGKTTVARRLLEDLDPQRYALGGIFGPCGEGDALLSLVVQDFGVRPPRPGEAFLTLQRFLRRQDNVDRETVIVIDEAQALDATALRQLWQLAAPPAGGQPWLHVVLVAQQLPRAVAELMRDGRTPPIGARWHMRPLEAAETHEFMRNRQPSNGATRQPAFDNEALDAIHDRSGGVLRRISLLCDRIPMFLAMEGRGEVSAQLVAAVDAQLRGEWSGTGLAVREPAGSVVEDLTSPAIPRGVEASARDGAPDARLAAPDPGSASDAPSPASGEARRNADAVGTAPALAGTAAPRATSWRGHWATLPQSRFPARLLAGSLLLVFLFVFLGLAMPWFSKVRDTMPTPARDLAAQDSSVQVPNHVIPPAQDLPSPVESPDASAEPSTTASPQPVPDTPRQPATTIRAQVPTPASPRSVPGPLRQPATTAIPAQVPTPAAARCSGPAESLGLCAATTAVQPAARATALPSAPVPARPPPSSCLPERAALGLCDVP